MVLGALLSVAAAIVLLVGALIEGGSPPLAALSLLADLVAGSCLTLALLQRRRHHPITGQLPTGSDPSSPPSGPTPGVFRPGHFPPGANPRP